MYHTTVRFNSDANQHAFWCTKQTKPLLTTITHVQHHDRLALSILSCNCPSKCPAKPCSFKQSAIIRVFRLHSFDYCTYRLPSIFPYISSYRIFVLFLYALLTIMNRVCKSYAISLLTYPFQSFSKIGRSSKSRYLLVSKRRNLPLSPTVLFNVKCNAFVNVLFCFCFFVDSPITQFSIETDYFPLVFLLCRKKKKKIYQHVNHFLLCNPLSNQTIFFFFFSYRS